MLCHEEKLLIFNNEFNINKLEFDCICKLNSPYPYTGAEGYFAQVNRTLERRLSRSEGSRASEFAGSKEGLSLF